MCSKVINWVSDNLKVKDNSHQNQDFFRASINPENLASKKCPKMPKKKSLACLVLHKTHMGWPIPGCPTVILNTI